MKLKNLLADSDDLCFVITNIKLGKFKVENTVTKENKRYSSGLLNFNAR